MTWPSNWPAELSLNAAESDAGGAAADGRATATEPILEGRVAGVLGRHWRSSRVRTGQSYACCAGSSSGGVNHIQALATLSSPGHRVATQRHRAHTRRQAGVLVAGAVRGAAAKDPRSRNVPPASRQRAPPASEATGVPTLNLAPHETHVELLRLLWCSPASPFKAPQSPAAAGCRCCRARQQARRCALRAGAPFAPPRRRGHALHAGLSHRPGNCCGAADRHHVRSRARSGQRLVGEVRRSQTARPKRQPRSRAGQRPGHRWRRGEGGRPDHLSLPCEAPALLRSGFRRSRRGCAQCRRRTVRRRPLTRAAVTLARCREPTGASPRSRTP